MRTVAAFLASIWVCSLCLGTTHGQEKLAAVTMVKLEPAKSETLLQYVPDDVVVVAAVQPARLINGKELQSMIEAAKGQDVLKQWTANLLEQSGIQLEEVEEIGILLDRETIEQMSKGMEAQFEPVAENNNLRQIGLAMHNFHDTFQSFPDDDGFNESKGNLSWRVHLLPYLEQAELYNEFHLDEPWDSEHNKTLIEQMPDVFRTEGIDEAGKTCVHVPIGEGAFGGEDPPSFRMITDGTSNTIMAVVAGTDTADVWTKPGGLEVNAEDPVKALGNIGDEFQALIMDGSTKTLSTHLSPEDLLYYFQPSDGHPVNDSVPQEAASPVLPGFIVRTLKPMDKQVLLEKLSFVSGQGTAEINGLEATPLQNGFLCVFPSPGTILFGSERTLKAMLEKRGKSGDTKARFEALYPANDAAVAIDMEPIGKNIEFFRGQLPIEGLISNTKFAQASVDFAGSQPSVLSIDIEMNEEGDAEQLSAMVNGGYQMLKAQAIGTVAQDDAPAAQKMSEVLTVLLDAVVIDDKDSHVRLDLPKPENASAMIQDLTPALAEIFKGARTAHAAVEKSRKLNSLKQIGLAFHNYHDTFSGFPSYNTPRNDQHENRALSWRVHLLPYLDEAELYNQFHLDEDWDSEHNKTLIEKMPKLFQCDGVEKPGHTAYHVFIGDETPFGGEEPIGISNITDGTSNTIMAVQAGPDTAEVWTKPGGLKFDATAPREALGKIGEQFMVLFCDGSARFLTAEIDDESLNRLIQHNDGMPVEAFQ